MLISLLSNFLKRSKRMVIALNIVFSWGWLNLQQNSDLRLGCSTISCRANKVQVGLIMTHPDKGELMSCMTRKKEKNRRLIRLMVERYVLRYLCARAHGRMEYLTMSRGSSLRPVPGLFRFLQGDIWIHMVRPQEVILNHQNIFQ